MSDRFVLFLPTDPAAEPRWLRLGVDGVVARGTGDPPAADGDRVVAVAPAADVTLHWAVLPDRSEAQALAAARVLVAEASAAPIAALHVAIGREGDGEARPVATVAVARMQAWLDAMAARGIDPDAIVPAPLLLPAPAEGFVRADLGDTAVVRGPQAGFADEPALTAMLTGGAIPIAVDHATLEAAVVRAVAAPALDLRQASFARRRPRATIDWGQARRLGWLAAALLLVTFAIGLVRLVRENVEASSLEDRAETLARQGLWPGETVNNADRQLDDRLLGLRGPGQGFTATAGAVFAAIRAVPEGEATAMSFDGKGALRISVATQGEGGANDLKRQIEAMGFTVRQNGSFVSAGGRISGDFIVTPR